MVEKIKIAAERLKNTVIPGYLICIRFNACIMKSVYFGYRIIKLTNKQENILRDIYKEIIAEKIGQEKKFSRWILHTWKTVMGIGLVKPLTAAKIQALKLYIGYCRVQTNTNKLLQLHDKMIIIEKGLNYETNEMKNQNTLNIAE